MEHHGCPLDIKLDECKPLTSENKLAILETKLSQCLTLRAVRYIKPSWKLIHNHNEAIYGRIMIIYDPSSLQLYPITSSRQIIRCHALNTPPTSYFYLSFVYAENSSNARLSLFSDIPFLRQNTHPWIAFGDFNSPLRLFDRTGGNPVSLNEIKALNMVMHNSDLLEIIATGVACTWNNKRKHGCRTFSNIDHAFCNLETITK